VRGFVGSFRVSDGGQIQDAGDMQNPAAYIALLDGETVLQEGWRFQRYPGFTHGQDVQWGLELTGFHGGQYTGLRVSFDPGVPLVYAGGTLLCLALMLSFLQRQRRFWARIEPARDRIRISLAGRALRHSAALEPEMALLSASLRPAAASAPAAPAPAKRAKRRNHR
jgi:cytochrome c biogenesis protein ResB